MKYKIPGTQFSLEWEAGSHVLQHWNTWLKIYQWVTGMKDWVPRTDNCQLQRNYLLQNCCAPPVGNIPAFWLSAGHPKMPRNGTGQPRPPAEGLRWLLDLQVCMSLYVLQQLHNTTKYQVFHTPPQDLVAAENPTHVLYSEKSVTAGQGLCSCHSPVNASRCIQSLLECFTFWQYGRSYFSPPVLRSSGWKSLWKHWCL